MNTKLTGIYAALFTPFDRDGNVMLEPLQRHVEFLIHKGIDGFYVNGSTGEAFLMQLEERKKVLEAVIEANAGRATIINHCGAIGTDLTLELVRHSAELPVDAISSVTPFYYHFSEAELVHYYNDLANASDKPFIVYNIPKLSGVVVTPKLMMEMRKNTRIQGLKFTHNDFAAMQAIKENDPDLIVYNGFDEMCICGMSLGCDGAIGSTYNVLAPIILKLRNCCKANDFKAALAMQNALNGYLFRMIANGRHFSIAKRMLTKIEGIDFGVARRPFLPLTPEEEKMADELVDTLLQDPLYI